MLSDRVRECLRHGQDCMRQAATQTDPKLRRDYLIIGACWLKLIRELERLDQQSTTPAKLKEGMEEGAFLHRQSEPPTNLEISASTEA
jgi:hypothetical protein